MIYLQKIVIDQNGQLPSSTEKIRCEMTAETLWVTCRNQEQLFDIYSLTLLA